MKTNMIAIQSRLRTLASAAVAITLFVLPTSFAFARGGHGGGHGGFHAGAAHASVAHSGFGPSGIHPSGMSHGRFAGQSIGSVRAISGRSLAIRGSQRSGTLNRHFVAGHHHHHGVFFGFYPYYYHGYPYYADVCNPYSPYYDPFYCQQLYYRGY